MWTDCRLSPSPINGGIESVDLAENINVETCCLSRCDPFLGPNYNNVIWSDVLINKGHIDMREESYPLCLLTTLLFLVNTSAFLHLSF